MNGRGSARVGVPSRPAGSRHTADPAIVLALEPVRARSVQAIVRMARGRGIESPLAPSTLHRLLAREGPIDRKPPDDAGRRRFACREAGESWIGDVMHGPRAGTAARPT